MPVACMLAMVVAVITIAAFLIGPRFSDSDGADAAIYGIYSSKSISLLAAERQQIVEMDAAARTLSTTSKPAVVSPSEVTGQDTGGGNLITQPPPVDPAAAQQIALNMLPSYGWGSTDQWDCLLDLWNQESGWQYDAINAVSGAYGIPQALPADKMAMFGSDWQIDPTTQIEWGLYYINTTYGTPCAAEDHEIADGFY
jgi:hypothetical protein